jgi:uncharacterized membrane protein YcaP (DUF421 family)
MELVLRTTVIFFFLWLVARATGKRVLSELSAFELLLLVTVGDLVQQGVTQEDMSLVGAMLAVGTLALLTTAFSYIGFRWRRVRPIIEGLPVVIVKDGRLLDEAMRIERLTEDDVKEEARQQGIADLSTVRLAVLEPDGKFSFVTGEQHAAPQKPRA